MQNGGGNGAESPMISIIDDDDTARDAIGDLVQSLGYRSVRFPSARQFLESDCLAETACLITDLQMPGMNGLELQEHLRVEGFATPVILVSAYAEDRFRARALNAGAIAFLSKPFREEALIECINTALAAA
jgi:FixJ family two-component response regulator